MVTSVPVSIGKAVDHRVVDEEPKPDNECAERDALQAHSGKLHGDEGDGKHQRNRNRDDDARAPTEREEAYGQDDGDGFDQGLDELANGLFNDLRLVGHQMGVDPGRQVGRCLGEALFEVLTECQDVAVLPHGDGEANGRATVVPEYRLLWVSVGSLHLGNVAQPKEPAIETEVDSFKALFGRELAGNANCDLLCI
jgi:hypothetical protein